MRGLRALDKFTFRGCTLDKFEPDKRTNKHTNIVFPLAPDGAKKMKIKEFETGSADFVILCKTFVKYTYILQQPIQRINSYVKRFISLIQKIVTIFVFKAYILLF